MKILGWMLIRMVAARFVAILLGISVLVLSLDLLSNAKDVQALALLDLRDDELNEFISFAREIDDGEAHVGVEAS